MKKRQVLITGLVFVVGFIVGCLAVAAYFGQSVRNMGQILGLDYRADWESRAFQAYSEENPRVGIWALNNLADVLRNQAELSEEKERELIQKDLLLTYTRLAIAYHAANEDKEYHQNISRAIALAKQVYPDSPNTEEHLLSIVKRLDHSAARN